MTDTSHVPDDQQNVTRRGFLSPLQASRRPKRSRSKRLRLPRSLNRLIAAGGPETFARTAAAIAAAIAARQEREFWLGVLEGVDQDDLDLHPRVLCSMYIRDLRRKLRLRQPKEVIREQTRLRVRRFRERRAQGRHPSDQEPVT
jgi:hypothetical protein